MHTNEEIKDVCVIVEKGAAVNVIVEGTFRLGIQSAVKVFFHGMKSDRFYLYDTRRKFHVCCLRLFRAAKEAFV